LLHGEKGRSDAGCGRSKQAGKHKKVEDDNRVGFFSFHCSILKMFGLSSLFLNDNKSVLKEEFQIRQ
jgi:hypothetical protein